jgi:hypothetical protein
MSNFTEFWDGTVKKAAEEVVEKCPTDKLVAYFVSQMIFYVEHDLADGRAPQLRLYPCVGTLNDESYYSHIHANTPKEEVDKLLNLGKLLKELLKSNYEE